MDAHIRPMSVCFSIITLGCMPCSIPNFVRRHPLSTHNHPPHQKCPAYRSADWFTPQQLASSAACLCSTVHRCFPLGQQELRIGCHDGGACLGSHCIWICSNISNVLLSSSMLPLCTLSLVTLQVSLCMLTLCECTQPCGCRIAVLAFVLSSSEACPKDETVPVWCISC